MKVITVISLIVPILKLIKCSEISQTKVPLLKKSDEFNMNYINAVLQSLYPICPLRTAVFSAKKDNLEFSQSPYSAASSEDPLELVFTKMYYDMENNKGATESSIYFKDSYLITDPMSPDHEQSSEISTNEPIKFFRWLTRELFKDSKYRELMQWELTTVRRAENDEKTINDYVDIFSIPLIEAFSSLPARSSSIQAYLDEFFARKSETVSVVIDGARQEKTYETFKQFANSPSILSFLITEAAIRLDRSITLPNGISYKLATVIYKESSGEYSVAYRNYDDSWIRLHDDEPVQQVNLESINAHMAFYMNGQCDNELASSPKPSQRLIMECLTKNYRYSISRTIRKQNSNSPPPKASSTTPLKSKQMSFGVTSQLSHISDLEITEFSRSTSNPLLTLPTLPLKNSPAQAAEIEQQLKSILVPEDLSHIKMNLVTTGSFNQNDESRSRTASVDEPKPRDKKKSKNAALEIEEESSDYIHDDFDLLQEKLSPSKPAGSESDLELEYFEAVPRKGPSVWDSFYLHPAHSNSQQAISEGMFAGFMDFEIPFDTSNRGNEETEAYHDTTVIDAESFERAASAKITKSRRKFNLEAEDDLVDSKPSSAKQQSQQQKSTKFSSVHATLASGLFYRATKSSAVLPVSASQDSADGKIGDTEKDKGGLKIKSTYSRL